MAVLAAATAAAFSRVFAGGSALASVQVWVKTGSIHEGGNLGAGLSHYLEHMLFKGTVTRAPGFVEREVEGVGGRINAGTSLDYTYYHTVLPAPRAIPAVEMLADMSVKFLPCEARGIETKGTCRKPGIVSGA